MPENNPDRAQVHISYERSPHYEESYVTGCLGGPNAVGDLVVKFFAEQMGDPQSFSATLPLPGEPGAGVPLTGVQTNVVSRIVKAGLIMSPAIAISLGEWLIQNGKASIEAFDGTVVTDGTSNQGK